MGGDGQELLDSQFRSTLMWPEEADSGSVPESGREITFPCSFKMLKIVTHIYLHSISLGQHVLLHPSRWTTSEEVPAVGSAAEKSVDCTATGLLKITQQTFFSFLFCLYCINLPFPFLSVQNNRKWVHVPWSTRVEEPWPYPWQEVAHKKRPKRSDWVSVPALAALWV